MLDQLLLDGKMLETSVELPVLTVQEDDELEEDVRFPPLIPLTPSERSDRHRRRLKLRLPKFC